MWFKHRAWIPIAWVLSLGNVVSIWFAAAPGEPWHATIHGALAVVFGVGAERLMARRRVPRGGEVTIGDERMKRFENAIDAIAVELERVGEGQRFVTKLLAESDRALERSRQASRPDALPTPRLSRPNEDVE